MPRLMSVAYTEAQVLDRTKTVTRRLGWLHATHLFTTALHQPKEPTP